MARLQDLFLVAAVVVASSSLSAATLTVDLNGGADYTDIQAAIDAAAEGDTVLVKPGEYVITEPIAFRGKGITVKGEAGADQTTIRMSETPTDPNRASVVIFENGETNTAVLEGVNITGGKGMYLNGMLVGGGVYCGEDSSPTFTNCTILGNSAPNGGGGLCCWGNASPALTNCMISGNAAEHGGGVFSENSSPTLTNCTISGNLARNGGGGLCCWGNASPALTNCIVWGNAGGAIGSGDDSRAPVVSYSCIESVDLWPGLGNININPQFCGWPANEVYVVASHAAPGSGTQADPYSHIGSALSSYRLSLQQGSPCIASGENGKDMGAATETCEAVGSRHCIIHLGPGTYPIQGFTLVEHVSIEGAGQETTMIEGTVYGLRTGAVLTGVTITKGVGVGGLVVASGEAPEVRDCTISGNIGGGVGCIGKSSPTLTNCTISGNSGISGGGVSCTEGSSPLLISCTITGNEVHFDICAGSGVYCSASSPTLINCTISGNRTLGMGMSGGMSCIDSSPTLTNCTISGNDGGVTCLGGSPSMTNCTISGNTGGGVYCDEVCTISNSVVWGNLDGSITLSEHSTANVAYSCVEGDSVWPGEGNINTDPLFVQPGHWEDCGADGQPGCTVYQWNPDTGEETAWHRWVFDYHLQSGSPAIDAGTSEGAPTTDIEGHGRPCGAGVDIGAYETGDCQPGSCGDLEGDYDGDGVTNGFEDLNGDGVCASHDTDGDSIPNILDPDDDGDGVPTADELAYQDTDGDEIPNYLDDDDDGDGVPSRLEDLNGNGDPSDDDPNSDGMPAYLDPNEKTPLVLFRRGDANDDSKTDISDAIATLGFLFLGNPNRLDCHKAADMDDSGVMDISDAVYLLNFQFLGGPAPEQPYPACGMDGTVDLLTCEEYIGCP